MSEERKKWPEQGQLRLAADRKGRGGAKGPSAERAVAQRQIPVFEDLPAFEEEDEVHGLPQAVARVALDERSLPGEQFRLLSARLRAIGRDKRLRRIGVVSSALGEGKTTVSLGLARALALDRQRRVLLLELDLRRPAVDKALGLQPPEVGLRQYLEGASDVPKLRRHGASGFFVLSAGPGVMESPEILSSPRMNRLFEAADRVFDFVIVDCPPLLPVADAVVIQDLLDGFVFVGPVPAQPARDHPAGGGAHQAGARGRAGPERPARHPALLTAEYAYRRYGQA